MAYATAPQETSAAGLEAMYGKPDQKMLERTDEMYGQMRLIWWEKKRCLCIKPDGTRQLYDGVGRL
jgi:hypothetical protein